MLSIIVAIAKNNIIGKDNKLIWHLPEDLKRFKKLTTGHTIIMGRKTFESLGKVLPNRKHVIITKNKEFSINDKNVEIINDISLIDTYIKSNEECFVIGGSSIYSQLMPYANKMYITEINEEFDGDTFFPDFDKNEWEVLEKEMQMDKNSLYTYEFITYIRK